MAAAAPAASRTVATTDNLRPPLLTLDQLKVDFAHVEKAVAELEAEFANIPPVIEDTEDLELATALAGRLIKAAKRCEEIRVEQNRPFLDASNLLNAHFKHDLTARCTAAKSKLEAITTTYQRKKAAREQALRDEQAAAARKLAEQAAQKVTEAVKTGDVKAATTAVTEANSLTVFANKAAAAASAPTSSMGLVKTESGTASLIDNWTFEDLDLDKIDLTALRPFFPRAAVEQALRQFIKSGRREITGARIFNDNKTRFRA
jgi:hypothetical protein